MFFHFKYKYSINYVRQPTPSYKIGFALDAFVQL